MSANYGGTEILEPLIKIFNDKVKATNKRDVLLFTDGSVANTSQVIDLCKQSRDHTRIFGVGMGSGCSTALVDGISHETHGKSIYVKCEDRMDTKVMQLAAFTLQPTITINRVEFHVNGEQIQPVDANLINETNSLHLFEEERLLSRFIIERDENCTMTTTLHIQYGNKVTQQVINVPIGNNEPVQPTKSLAGLYAEFCAQQIQRVEYVSNAYRLSNEDRDCVIDWAKRGNILNRLTAFVGIAERQNDINYWTNSGVPQIKSDFFDPSEVDSNTCVRVDKGTLHKDLISVTDIDGLITDLDQFKRILLDHEVDIAMDHFDCFIANTDMQLECALSIAALHIMQSLCRQYYIEWRLWERKLLRQMTKCSITSQVMARITRQFAMTLIV